MVEATQAVVAVVATVAAAAVVAEEAAAGGAVVEATDQFVPDSLLLQWHITGRCNLRCSHCYESERSGELPFSDLLVILGQFRKLLESFRSAVFPQRVPGHVSITGGEPLLRGDLFPLLEELHSCRDEFGFALLSNGGLVDRTCARHLKALAPRFMQVSVEGNQETHDRIRGEGDFERVIAGIRTLRREEIPVFISFTAQRSNFREFRQVAALGRQLGVQRVWADRFIPVGGAGAQREMVLSPDETREFLGIMEKERKGLVRRNSRVAMHRALQFLPAGGRPYRCTAAESLITVLPNGDLCPCRRLPIVVGNLLENPLLDLYYQSALFKDLRAVISCADCSTCLFARACGGGLRCLSHAMTGSYRRRDPGCWVAG